MTPDIERVAKAIYYDFCSPLADSTKPFWSNLPKPAREFLTSQARAGMIDLRTPSEAMIAAGERLCVTSDKPGGPEPQEIWACMMDAALGELVTPKHGN